jgi:hypothetical protein
LFGKERTWAYRQLYAGKIEAVTEFGRTLIPHSQVEKIVGKAGRYLGANTKPAKQAEKAPPSAAKSADPSFERVPQKKKASSNLGGAAQAENRRGAVAKKWQKP